MITTDSDKKETIIVSDCVILNKKGFVIIVSILVVFFLVVLRYLYILNSRLTIQQYFIFQIFSKLARDFQLEQIALNKPMDFNLFLDTFVKKINESLHLSLPSREFTFGGITVNTSLDLINTGTKIYKFCYFITDYTFWATGNVFKFIKFKFLK